MKHLKKEYIPNYLSLFRILLIPLFIYLFLYDGYSGMLWGGAVFVLAGITDIVDGFLARKFRWVTNIGKLLDPLADKLMQIAAIICLYIRHMIPGWLIVTIIFKELLMMAGAALILKRGNIYVHSNWYGKLGTTVFYAVVVIIILIDNRYEQISNLLSVLLFALTLFTLVMYYIKTYRGIYVKNKRENKINS
ncbi:MAG: CDP-diacylglycerol--glycerol-3-phosphate 3-phosphatidyltransferase [Ruminococcaceae bacterium]|nr:CDP-diacylglycerol--glycerol-3-phosphate 3-phosphatidyltransferase [Oscillospiraceae bacterium]